MNENLFEVIEHRRSIRKFSDKPVEKEKLEAIVKEAMFAENAGNRRQQHIIVSTNQEINERMGKIHNILGAKYRSGQPLTFTKEEVSKAASGFYNAPAVIYFFGPDEKHFLFSKEDAAILIDHMYLVSYTYGLGACMIGKVTDDFNTVYGQYLKKRWHIPDGYTICAYLVMGYPQAEYPDKPQIASNSYPEVIFEE